MPGIPNVIAGVARKGPYEGYSLNSYTVIAGGQTLSISVSDGGELAKSQTITLKHTNGTLTATTNSNGEFSFNLGSLSSYSEGDAFTLEMDTLSDSVDDPEVRMVMLRDSRGKLHDDDYPIPFKPVIQLNSQPFVIGNPSRFDSITRGDLQPDYTELTFPNGEVYRQTLSYNSDGVVIGWTSWVKQ